MANSTIPNLVAVTVPAVTDLFGVRQSGDTRDKKLTVTQLLTLIPGVTDPLLLSAGTAGAPTYSFSGDPDTGVFNVSANILGLSAGGQELLRIVEGVQEQVIVSPGALFGTAALPALAFGDGDTGFYEAFDDTFNITIAGINRFTFADAANSYQGVVTGAGSLRNEVSSVTNPTLGPRNDDADTGIGSGTADTVSIIGGGVELARFVEAVSTEQALILNNDNTGLPDLASLGDPDTGWSWDIANGMYWNGGGSRSWNFSTAKFNSQFSDGPAMVNVAAGLTTPTLLPDQADADTGLGGNGADVLSLIAGGVEMARVTEGVGINQLTVIASGSSAVPDIGGLADTDTGLRWTGANQLSVVAGGIRTWHFTTGQFFSEFSEGPAMVNTTGAIATPTLLPVQSDPDTGLSASGNDLVGVVAGGIVGISFRELNTGVIQAPDAEVAITAFATGGQASATQLNQSNNVITTVATTGDSVKLPPTFLINSVMFIKNDGVNAADVFPHTGGNLGAGLNTAVSLAAGESASFIATTANLTWTPFIVSGGGGGGDVTKVGTPANDQVGVWTGDGTIEGTAALTLDTAALNTTLRFRSAFGSSGAPAHSFTGETNSGLFRQSAGVIMMSIAGTGSWVFRGTSFDSNIADGPRLMFEAATATNPTFIPRLADTDSGLGSGAADEVNLIAGGLNCLAVREVAAVRQIGFYGTTPAPQSAAYSRAATIVESRALVASASATVTNNNNVLAALIADLQALGLIG